VAGPISFAALRRRGQARHSWLAFAAVVAVFSVLTWGGAVLLRSQGPKIEHFTVLDYDAGSGSAHVHSWLTLAAPTYGALEVAVGGVRTVATPAPEDPSADALRDPPSGAAGSDTLACPGLEDTVEAIGFVNTQRYAMSAEAPNLARPPMRSTARQFELDYMTPPHANPDALGEHWPMPRGQARMDAQGSLHLALTHHLPGILKNVVVVYCPGNGLEPQAWSQGNWGPDALLARNTQPWPALAQQGDWAPGAVLLGDDGKPMAPLFGWRWAPGNAYADVGFLVHLEEQKPGGDMMSMVPPHSKPEEKEISDDCQMLSLYGALPPAEFWNAKEPQAVPDYYRKLGRGMDLSPLLVLRRVMVLGLLDLTEEPGLPLAAPLRVGGAELRARGWVFVRLIVPVE
jgi:hypothetical protein